MQQVIHITASGDQTLTFDAKGTYVVLLDQVSGEFRFTISKPHIELLIFGKYNAKGSDTYSLSTIQHHTAPNSTSRLLIKGVFDGASRFSYRGLIRIEKDCNGSHAYQKNQNLILSSRARVESEPDLEILSNDVFCTHGSTTGSVSPSALYYLYSRALSKAQATRLLCEGFLRDVDDQWEQANAQLLA